MVADAAFSREAPASMHGRAPARGDMSSSVLGAAAVAECAGGSWLATAVAEATDRRGLDGLRLPLHHPHRLLHAGLLHVLHVAVLLLLLLHADHRRPHLILHGCLDRHHLHHDGCTVSSRPAAQALKSMSRERV